MATDKSEPRVGLIMKLGVLAVVTLIVVHAVLVSYFDHMARGEEYRKIGSARPEALMSVRADEMQQLSRGSIPIDKAVEMMATRGRAGAVTEVMPKSSKDIAPLQGWVQMPGEVPAAMMAAIESSATSGAGASLDAGADAASPGLSRGRDQDASTRDGAAAKHPQRAH